MNRVLPELFTHADEEIFDALREPRRADLLVRKPVRGRSRYSTRPGSRCRCAGRKSSHLARLRDEVDLPLLLVPYLFVRDHGLRVTRMVAEALGQELGTDEMQRRRGRTAGTP